MIIQDSLGIENSYYHKKQLLRCVLPIGIYSHIPYIMTVTKSFEKCLKSTYIGVFLSKVEKELFNRKCLWVLRKCSEDLFLTNS